MKTMTDFDAVFGVWRARACEWKDSTEPRESPECGKTPLEGRAYCQECYDKAYQKPVKKTKKRRTDERAGVPL